MDDVVQVLNHRQAATWTVERLRRTVRRLAAEGIIETLLLDRFRPHHSHDRLVRLVAGIKAVAPDRHAMASLISQASDLIAKVSPR